MARALVVFSGSLSTKPLFENALPKLEMLGAKPSVHVTAGPLHPKEAFSKISVCRLQFTCAEASVTSLVSASGLRPLLHLMSVKVGKSAELENL